MKGYTTKTAVENYIGQNIDDSFNTQIEEWIEGVENFIDKYTKRISFVVDEGEDDVVRKYDGDNEDDLLIESAISISKIEVDDEEIDSDDYLLYPANDIPKTKIVMKDGERFARGQQNVSVTGKFGYSVEVPKDIKMAATILVAGITRYSDKSKGKVRSETVGRYTVSYSDEKGWNDFKRVYEILDSYRDIRI